MIYRRAISALCVHFVGLSVALCVSNAGASEMPLRLFSKDGLQEARTTSVNWLDVRPLREWKTPAPKPTFPTEILPGAFRVVIDPGHGGKDDGAQGLYGISEKEAALRISYLVYRELERERKRQGLNMQVMLTREGDGFLSLKERTRIANEWGADVFISLHLNSSPVTRARGFEVYFLNSDSTDEAARRLAQVENREHVTVVKSDVLSILDDVRMNRHIVESSRLAEVLFQSISLKIRSNGRGVRQAPFSVLSGTSMPAALVEVGYVTHPEEAKHLSTFSYLKRVAGSISQGIIEYAKERNEIRRPRPQSVTSSKDNS